MILCIDPGVRAAGVALFDDKELTTAWLAEGKDWEDTADSVMRKLPVNSCLVQEVVVEHMQIYKQTGLAQANDLITVSMMAGRVTGLFSGWASAKSYLPRDWKGQVPKDIMVKRVEKVISKEELKRVDWPSADKRHNVWDAISIGLFRVGRTMKGGIRR